MYMHVHVHVAGTKLGTELTWGSPQYPLPTLQSLEYTYILSAHTLHVHTLPLTLHQYQSEVPSLELSESVCVFVCVPCVTVHEMVVECHVNQAITISQGIFMNVHPCICNSYCPVARDLWQ